MKIEIFKVGKHTSSNGVTKEYTLDDLNQIVANHSEPTPIVVGHPKTDSPAFGWIENLFVKGESLFAEAKEIVPEFLELIKKKIYPNRSASFSTNKDGTLQLKHVGFLGGTLPAVKGLEILNLNADESNTVSFTFNADSTQSNTNSNILNIEFEEEAQTNQNSFAETITDIKTQLKKVTQFMEAFQPPQNSVDLVGMQAKIDELNLKIDSAYFQKNLVEKLKLDDLTPAIKNKIVNLLSYFQSFDFSEEDQTKIFSDFQELVNLIQPFQTEEVLKKVFPLQKGTEGDSEFSEMNVDKDALILYNEAQAYAKENEVSFNDALIILTKESEV